MIIELSDKEKLTDETIIVKARIKTLKNNFLEMGERLSKIKTYCRALNITFRDYVEENFEMGERHANKLIALHQKFGGYALGSKLSYRKLVLLLPVPDDEIDEVIDIVEENNMSHRDITKFIKSKKREWKESPLKKDPSDKFEDRFYKWKHKAKRLMTDYENLAYAQDKFLKEYSIWTEEAEKYRKYKDGPVTIEELRTIIEV